MADLDPRRQRAALRMIEDDERAAEFHEREAKRLRVGARARRKVWELPQPEQSSVDELLVAGDYMQSSLSRLCEYLHARYSELPYEVGMAVLEGRTGVDQWTEARRKS